MKYAFVVLIGAVALSGCAGSQPIGNAGPGPNQIIAYDGNDLPPPKATDQIAVSADYLIGPYDKLRIDVFGVEEMTGRVVQADGGGRIAFPLAGELDVAGRTPLQVSGLLRERLMRYMRDPQVTVNIEEAISQVVTVDGEVKQPGMYPVIGGMTLTRAVATARGTSEFAKLDDVVVFRKVDGQQMVALYNLKAIRRGNYRDPSIYAGDVVIVGDSPSRRIFKDVLSAVPLLTTPLIYLLRD